MKDGLLTIGDIIQPGDDLEVCIVAVDLEAQVWTCVEKITNDIKLFRIDENLNMTELAMNCDAVFDDHDDEC